MQALMEYKIRLPIFRSYCHEYGEGYSQKLLFVARLENPFSPLSLSLLLAPKSLKFSSLPSCYFSYYFCNGSGEISLVKPLAL